VGNLNIFPAIIFDYGGKLVEIVRKVEIGISPPIPTFPSVLYIISYNNFQERKKNFVGKLSKNFLQNLGQKKLLISFAKFLFGFPKL
jgi:hypothetical protein